MPVSLICIVMRESAPVLAEYADCHRESDLFVRDLERLARSLDALNRRARSPHMELPLRPLRDMTDSCVHPESFQIARNRCMLGQTDLQIDPSGILYMCDVKHTASGT